MKNVIDVIQGEFNTKSLQDGKEQIMPEDTSDDMITMIDDKPINKDMKFLEVCSSDCRLAVSIYNFLMRKLDNTECGFANDNEKSDWILNNMIYVVASSTMAMIICRKTLYSDMNTAGNVILIDDINNIVQDDFKNNTNEFEKIIKVKFGDSNMKFDVVVGNPPYNNDIYIDFVTLGHKLAKQCSVWITPAKWQAKGGKKNEDFRKDIVPHMSKIVFYPVAFDLFDILEPDGISYYILGKAQSDRIIVENKSSTFDIFNSVSEKQFNSNFVLLNCAESLIYRMTCYKRIHFNLNDYSKKYKVVAVTKAPGMTHANNKNTPIFITSILIIDEHFRGQADRISIFSFDNIDEAKSAISYMYTRLVRFMFYASQSKLTGIYNDFDWRFVPDPGSFDKIYEDNQLSGYEPDENGEYIDSNGNKHCSLYKKYNLTDEEINIIESVVKERK